MSSHPVVRFYRGGLLLGSAEAPPGSPLLEVAEAAGVEIPSNCTSGTCGTCMATVKRGSVLKLDPLPIGLDEDLVVEGAVLCCIQMPEGACDIDVRPPI